MSEIRKPKFNKVNVWQLLLVLLTIVLALITGASFFVISSVYTPLIVLSGVIAVIALFSWLKKPVWALYFTLFVVLLPTSLIPAEVNSYLNRISTVIALVAWVIDFIRRRSRIIVTTSTLFMLFFIGWAAITLLWADNISIGVNILQRYMLRMILFLLLIVNEIRDKKHLDGLMATLTLSGWLIVVVSAITVFLQGYTPGTRLQVFDVNANGLGISLLITLPAVLWRALRPTKHNRVINKWLAAIFLFASIGLIGLSGSRGSAISLGITLLAFLFWKPTRSWGIVGLIIVVLAVFTAPIVFSTTITRFLGTTGETTLGGREYLWTGGWLLIKDHLLMGVGIGNSSYQVIPYIMNLGLRLSSPEAAVLHNPVMVIWAETGLPGLLLYLGILANAIILFARQYLQSRRRREKFLMPYYALVASVFLGYTASWIKGGGMESDFSYFLMLALLLLPTYLNFDRVEYKEISTLQNHHGDYRE